MVEFSLNVSGPRGARSLPLTNGARVGRSADCAIVLDHPAVAPAAAEFSFDGSTAQVASLGGVVALNQARLNGAHSLQHGDELKLGPFRISITAVPAPHEGIDGGQPISQSNRHSASGPFAAGPYAPVPVAPGAPPPPPKPPLALVRVDIRSRLGTGDGEHAVTQSLVDRGFTQREAAELIEQERAWLRQDTRRRGVRDIVLGALAMSGALGWFTMLMFSVLIPNVAFVLIPLGVFGGAWMILRGILRVVLPIRSYEPS
ncbi:MAG: FHA domain-containing protein [Polyangiaceae bacterium]|nr:FHA domain-containing protein [Polyangiaceae bacterium]